MTAGLKIIEPKSIEEFDSYFQLRWEILRKPWGQPKGSERNEFDSTGINRMVLDEKNHPIGVGMLLINSIEEAQIRFMGVSENCQGMRVGTILMDCLESIACEHRCSHIILQSRENAVKFYEKSGFKVVKKSYLLFGEIQHFLMKKNL
jgi:ribosomal protein S18 acetylase RimI-like enzyme